MSNRFAEPMARLIDELRKLPGVGTKSAQRFAFHLLRSSDADADALAHAILTLKQHLRLCSVCNNITDVDPCTYCTSPVRNRRLICVVEEPTNISGVEKTHSYNGLYHVLHGTLSPIGGVGPDQLRLRNLWPRLEGFVVATSVVESSAAENGQSSNVATAEEPMGGDTVVEELILSSVIVEESVVEELILAISPTVEGEATARYVADEARRRRPGLRVTRIATGVPAGSDIEYADEVTMTHALEGRREL